MPIQKLLKKTVNTSWLLIHFNEHKMVNDKETLLGLKQALIGKILTKLGSMSNTGSREPQVLANNNEVI